MTESHWERVKELFAEASELPTQLRGGFLDEACGDDADLRGEVESLLGHHVAAEVTHGGSTDDGGHTLSEGPGTVIGRYKLLEEIGQGGMGVVYMAEQTEPVRRKVALKIIKLGMDTKEVVARFEAERQALAMMDHPNIAKVLDGGATVTGRPYFVMELVRGVPITTFCEERTLSGRERLELFRQVCLAIQHAHTKGVIHRDIKPTNVMITLHDGVPVPRIIDFGIAKATDQSLTEKTYFTQYSQIIGTPEYMAPEQAEMSGLDIDTRADIYSLGVLLYELVTGTKPFDLKTLLESGYQEMLRTIREVDPPKPSTRMATLARSLTGSAAPGGVDPLQVSRQLTGDLDWIVMRALEKDRTRRYETAADFARDIGRHLADEPVHAGPPSAVYRARKAARRHKAALAACGVAAVALLAGSVLGGVAFRNALRDRETAVGEREAALAAVEAERTRREQAVVEREQALAELEQAVAERQQALADFETERVVNSFWVEQALQPAAMPVGEMPLLLDAVLRAGEESFSELPGLQARLHADIGRAALRVGDVDLARRHVPQAFDMVERVGAEGRGALRILTDVGELWTESGDPQQGVALQTRVVEASRRALGDDDPLTVEATSNLAVLYVTSGHEEFAIRLMGEAFGNTTLDFDLQHLGLAEEADIVRVRGVPGAWAGPLPPTHAVLDPGSRVRRKLVHHATRPGALVDDKCRAVWFLLSSPRRTPADIQAALTLAIEAAERRADDPLVLDLLARARFLAGDAEGAVSTQQDALGLVPPQQTLLRGDMQAALEVFQGRQPPEALTVDGLFERPWLVPDERELGDAMSVDGSFYRWERREVGIDDQDEIVVGTRADDG